MYRGIQPLVSLLADDEYHTSMSAGCKVEAQNIQRVNRSGLTQ